MARSRRKQQPKRVTRRRRQHRQKLLSRRRRRGGGLTCSTMKQNMYDPSEGFHRLQQYLTFTALLYNEWKTFPIFQCVFHDDTMPSHVYCAYRSAKNSNANSYMMMRAKALSGMTEEAIQRVFDQPYDKDQLATDIQSYSANKESTSPQCELIYRCIKQINREIHSILLQNLGRNFTDLDDIKSYLVNTMLPQFQSTQAFIYFMISITANADDIANILNFAFHDIDSSPSVVHGEEENKMFLDTTYDANTNITTVTSTTPLYIEKLMLDDSKQIVVCMSNVYKYQIDSMTGTTTLDVEIQLQGNPSEMLKHMSPIQTIAGNLQDGYCLKDTKCNGILQVLCRQHSNTIPLCKELLTYLQ